MKELKQGLYISVRNPGSIYAVFKLPNEKFQRVDVVTEIKDGRATLMRKPRRLLVAEHKDLIPYEVTWEPTLETPTGMAAMGHAVPFSRLAAALDHMRQIYKDCGEELDTEEARVYLSRAASYLEKDEPFKAMQVLYPDAIPPVTASSPDVSVRVPRGKKMLDLTGAYRIFAVLLSG